MIRFHILFRTAIITSYTAISKFCGLVEKFQAALGNGNGWSGIGFSHTYLQRQALKAFETLDLLRRFVEAFSTTVDKHLYWLGDMIFPDTQIAHPILRRAKVVGANGDNAEGWHAAALLYLDNLVSVIRSLGCLTRDAQVTDILDDLEV